MFKTRAATHWVTTILALLISVPVAAQEDAGWPRELTGPQGARVVVFQPQIEALQGDKLSGRAAVSVTPAGKDDRIFGVAWFKARLLTDLDTRTAAVLDLEVPRVHFADAPEEEVQALTDLLEHEIPKMNLDLSLDRLLTSLGVSETRLAAAEGLNNEPPEIIFARTPTVLVLIDGEPVLRDLEGSGYRYVANSPFVMVEDAGRFFLYAGQETWYESRQAVGPWQVARSLPQSITELIPEEDRDAGSRAEGERSAEPPGIIVRTSPAELIVSEGEPEFAPLAGGKLLFMSNTESDVLKEIATQRIFVLLSGRWFAASSHDGPWTFVAPGELPETFQAIETDGEMAHLRASVAGTAEAQESVLDAQIAQTAAIDRDTTIEVEYDGDPRFETIQGTDLHWAVNTATQVIRYQDRYYAVDAGVWFTAAAPGGPWNVATEIPDAIYTQPSTSPTYNTTFVYVFDATPRVVFVGHHPGYLWSFHHRGCLFWGTGWHHSPWTGRRHFPRHATWGWHVRWHPFWGWGVGTTWSHGRFTFGMSWSSWGRTSRSAWVGASNWHAGFRAGYRAGRRDQLVRNQNIYNRARNRSRNADLARSTGGSRAAVPNRTNNVYADRNGNVHRQAGDGSWQQRQQGEWRSSEAGQRAQQQARVNAGNRTRTNQSLNRERSARQRGTARTQSFNRGGASRSRGGRRR